jgi:hypothetical protein
MRISVSVLAPSRCVSTQTFGPTKLSVASYQVYLYPCPDFPPVKLKGLVGDAWLESCSVSSIVIVQKL